MEVRGAELDAETQPTAADHGVSIRAGEEMQSEGTFAWLKGMASGAEVKRLMGG